MKVLPPEVCISPKKVGVEENTNKFINKLICKEVIKSGELQKGLTKGLTADNGFAGAW